VLLLVVVVGCVLTAEAALLVLITTNLLAALTRPVVGDLVATAVGDFASSSEDCPNAVGGFLSATTGGTVGDFASNSDDFPNAVGRFLSATTGGLTVPLGCDATFVTLIVGSIIICLTGGCCLGIASCCFCVADKTTAGCFGGRPRRLGGTAFNGSSDDDNKDFIAVSSAINQSNSFLLQ